MTEESMEQICEKIKINKSYLVGVCGIPGAGKSHYAKVLQQNLPNSIIVPMDGYHLYRKDLTPQGFKYRGAAFTFDLTKFKVKILEVQQRKTYPIAFPSFDHAAKDPLENSIILESDIQHVIVEGLYLFDQSLGLNCWDSKIWVDCELQTAMQRVAKRHFECGIEADMECAWERTNSNDRRNAEYVLAHSDRTNCTTIKN